jgi:molybdopterin-guanine dinucleotide biosynthesis protein A
MMKVAGFVLTGGRSTRMGRDKATLSIDGQPLCEHIGGVLASVAEKVFLIGHPERYQHLNYECVADIHPDLGPLSGLETALSLACAEFHLVVGCDALNIEPAWLRALLAEAELGRRCVVAEDQSGKRQPLCAVYRSDCLPVVRAALSERRLRMMDLLAELAPRTVKIEGVVSNLNTREEYNGMVHADRRK